MTRISIDNALSSQLDQASGPVILCDANGRVLGRFTPEEDGPILKPEDGCPDPDEEIQAAIDDALADPGVGKPLAQIWKELGRDQ